MSITSFNPINFRACQDCCTLQCKPPLIARPTDYFSASIVVSNKVDFDPADIGIYTESGTLIDVLDANDTTQYGSTLLIRFKWSKYITDNGIYKLCYNKEYIYNGTFADDLDGWTQVGAFAEWTEASGATSVDLDSNQSNELYQDLTLELCENTLIYDVILIENEQVAFSLYINDELIRIDTLNTIGTHNLRYTFTPEFIYNKLAFIVSAASETTVGLTNVSIINQVCSECFEIGNHLCNTILVQAYNNSEAFGFVSQYRADMRVWGRMHKIRPTHTENIFRGASGKYTNVYTDISLTYEIESYNLHSDQLMALIMMLSFDVLTIDGIEYVKKEGNVEIDWNDKKQLGRFKQELHLKEQKFRKEF